MTNAWPATSDSSLFDAFDGLISSVQATLQARHEAMQPLAEQATVLLRLATVGLDGMQGMDLFELASGMRQQRAVRTAIQTRWLAPVSELQRSVDMAQVVQERTRDIEVA